MSDLLVKHNDNGIFTDYSKEAKDYLRDSFQIVFEAANDVMYIGLYKPFNSFYIDIATTDSLAALSFDIGGNIIAMDDDTNSLKRSGFMQFTKPVTWALSTIDGVEAFWMQIDSSTDFDITFNGINMVFADDNDLSQEARNINNLMAKGDTSFIAYHTASRNEIIQSLRNGGYNKFVDDKVANITKWDILEFGEIRQAAKYLALAKIFFDISENVEDKFYNKFRDYEGMFGAAFKTFYLKLDQDDDGVYNQEYDLTDGSIEIIRA